MAQNFFTFPLDQPRLQAPGVMYREAGAPGNDSHIALPPEHPIRARKGDKSMTNIPHFEPRALSHSGTPFKGIK
jgi:hypothetical protein